MILVVSKNQNLSKLLESKITNVGEEMTVVMPGFSFVNQLLELEIASVNAIVFDEDSMDRTISILENSGELELVKTINFLKVVKKHSDDYIYSTVNAIEIEEDAIEDQFEVLIKSFME